MNYRAIHIFSVRIIDHQLQIPIVNEDVLPFLYVLRQVFINRAHQR